MDLYATNGVQIVQHTKAGSQILWAYLGYTLSGYNTVWLMAYVH